MGPTGSDHEMARWALPPLPAKFSADPGKAASRVRTGEKELISLPES